LSDLSFLFFVVRQGEIIIWFNVDMNICLFFVVYKYKTTFSISLFCFSDKTMPIVKSTSTSESTTNEAREALDCLHELSQLLNTGLDKKTLTACVRLLEAGVHPDALAQIIQVLRTETRPTKL
jgi:mitotic-spindle organizing protein 1